MTTVFVAGSRKLGRLNEELRQRLENVISKKFRVIIGDANGADKAVQRFLWDKHYQDVVVYCSGEKCRNNIGNWVTHHVDAPDSLKGREFYEQKDKAMAAVADYGLMIWDGESVGTLKNVLELLKSHKKSLVYLSGRQEFIGVASLNDAEALLTKCAPESIDQIKKKVSLRSELNKVASSSQGGFNF